VLAEANIYQKVRGVIGASAGTLNALTFVSGATERTLGVYQDFARSGSIDRQYLLSALASRFRQKILGRKHTGRGVIDIESVINCVHRAGLTVEGVRQQKIEFLVRCLNVKRGRQEYFDMHTHPEPVQVIADSISAVPYCTPSPRHKDYIDPMIQVPIAITPLLERYKAEQIVVISNSPPRHYSSLRGVLTQVLHGVFSLDWRLLRHYVGKRRIGEREMKRAIESERVIFVGPPDDYPMTNSTTDLKKIRAGFDAGRRAGDALLKRMGL
jgi:predicted patatin/cPLA2 family phospholipase